jgi:hypothetical protein
MNKQLAQMLLTALFTVLTPENLRKFVDAGLDAIEDLVQESENKIDDAIVLPICKTIRTAFNVPDNDEQPTE